MARTDGDELTQRQPNQGGRAFRVQELSRLLFITCRPSSRVAILWRIH